MFACRKVAGDRRTMEWSCGSPSGTRRKEVAHRTSLACDSVTILVRSWGCRHSPTLRSGAVPICEAWTTVHSRVEHILSLSLRGDPPWTQSGKDAAPRQNGIPSPRQCSGRHPGRPTIQPAVHFLYAGSPVFGMWPRSHIPADRMG